MKTSTLKVKGMGCAGCVNTVEEALNNLEGVITARVDLSAGTATVTYDENQTGFSNFEKSIRDSGYALEGEIS